MDDSRNSLLVSKQLIWDLDFENKFDPEESPCAIKNSAGSYGPYSRSYQPVEEPWLLESSAQFQSVRPEDASNGPTEKNDISVDLKVNSLTNSKRDLENTARFYPVEEPWIFLSSPALHDYENEKIIKISNNKRFVENKAECQIQQPQIQELSTFGEGVWESVGNDAENEDEIEEVLEELSIDDERRVALQESVTKVILINSSLCTMQRIAVMEDGKLVEILLEPVKDNVQSDSVYLGVVTKFVPRMGGAFVNIGCSRPSLLDTNHNWEPFIFPPFRRQRKQQSKTVDRIEEHDVIENSVQTMPDDDGDDDVDDESEVVGPAKETNGKIRLHRLTESARNSDGSKWGPVQKGTKIIVQVVKEGLGTKGPTLTAYPKLRSRFWVCSIFYLFYDIVFQGLIV